MACLSCNGTLINCPFCGQIKGDPVRDHQTHFSYSKDHFSLGHADHLGYTSPIQRDLDLRLSNGKHFKTLGGVDSPNDVDIQTNLYQFKLKY